MNQCSLNLGGDGVQNSAGGHVSLSSNERHNATLATSCKVASNKFLFI